MLTEPQILEYIADINKIIDAETANTVVAYLNGAIADLDLKWFELKTEALNYKFKLLARKEVTNKLSEAEYEASELYTEFKKTELSLRKLRALRNNLKDKEEGLRFKPRYGNYERAIN